MATSNLQHEEDHVLLLGRKTSPERIAAFILEMDQRLAAPGILTLPMSPRDIADYLGLTLETVSRSLTRMRKLGILPSSAPLDAGSCVWTGNDSPASIVRTDIRVGAKDLRRR